MKKTGTQLGRSLVIAYNELVTCDKTSEAYDLGSGGWPEGAAICLDLSEVNVYHGRIEILVRLWKDGRPEEIGGWTVAANTRVALVLPADPAARKVDLRYWAEGVCPQARLTAWLEPMGSPPRPR